ncbi:hypothetical protein EMIT07CA2_60169 [Brevibacillus sp. IT-7CA2]
MKTEEKLRKCQKGEERSFEKTLDGRHNAAPRRSYLGNYVFDRTAGNRIAASQYV